MSEHDSQRLEFALRAITALQDRVAVLERLVTATRLDADEAGRTSDVRPTRTYGYQYAGDIPRSR